MRTHTPIIETLKEIENYAMSREKEAKISGLTFDASDFIKQVEHIRLTTHMDLRQAFEATQKNYKPTGGIL